MTYSQAKIDAFAKLDEAVDALRAAYSAEDDEKDKSVLTGYVLLTSAIEFVDKSDDVKDDDLDTVSLCGAYSRRGQDPTLTYGIINEAIRHHNNVNLRYGGE
jgi:hypothetical protein